MKWIVLGAGSLLIFRSFYKELGHEYYEFA